MGRSPTTCSACRNAHKATRMPRLDAIADIRMGATLRGRDATRPDPKGLFHFIRIGDVSQEGTFRNTDFIKIDPDQPINEELRLRSGDVLFPNRGTRTTAIVYRLDVPHTIVGAQFFIVRATHENRLLPEYLAWFLRSEECARYFETQRKGTYVQIIQRSALTGLQVPLPPYEMQRTIVQSAQLAHTERQISEKLASLRYRRVEEKLLQAARDSASLI